jgi:hypothetical protein
MPCYSVNLLSVNIEASDREILETAINKLGLKYRRQKDDFFITTDYGTINITGNQAKMPALMQSKLNEIKQAYSAAVIEKAAEEFSWTVTEEEDTIVLRRYTYE